MSINKKNIKHPIVGKPPEDSQEADKLVLPALGGVRGGR